MYSFDYNVLMQVKTHPAFSKWFDGLKDRQTKVRLAARLDKARAGNLGDHKSVGDGVFEMREAFGPGWRMYYVQRGNVLIVMIGGGDKSSQARDIAAAKALAADLEE